MKTTSRVRSSKFRQLKINKTRALLFSLVILVLLVGGLPSVLPQYYQVLSLPKPLVSNASTPAGYFLKSPSPASVINNVAVSSDPNGIGVTVAALAGEVARSQPKIWVSSGQQDNFWLQYIEGTYGITANPLTVNQVLQAYAPAFEVGGNVQIVEYNANDPQFPMQLDMARTDAGVFTALPVDSNDISLVQGLFPGHNTIIINENANTCTGAGDPRLACFQDLWNRDHAFVTKHTFAIPNNGRQQSSDYYVEFSLFEFEFTCAPAKTNCSNSMTPAESTWVQGTILPAFSGTPNLQAFGFFGLGGESTTISTLAGFQIEMKANEEASDLSFMSGFPSLTNLIQPPESMPVYNAGNKYVMFMFTQGDAQNYPQNINLATWQAIDPSCNCVYRSEFTATWQLDPMMAQISPPVLKYYYSTTGPLQYFITGPSGSGYTHPDCLPNENSYGALVNQFGNNSNMQTTFAIFGGGPCGTGPTTTALRNFASASGTSDIELWNTGHSPLNQILNSNNVSAMFAAFWTPSITTFGPSDVSMEISQIESHAAINQFVMVIMNAQNPGMPFIKQVLAGLPGGYVDVRGDQYACLYRQSQGKECNTASPPPLVPQVTLSANTTFPLTNHVVTLTAIANPAVPPNHINIVQTDNNTEKISCSSGVICQVNVNSSIVTTVHFQANIGSLNNASGGITAISPIITVIWNTTSPPPPPPVCPSGFTLCLQSNTTTLIGSPVVLNATLIGFPANQTTYTIQIIDLHNNTVIASCASGNPCSVTVRSNTAYYDTYQAKAIHN